MKKSITIFLFSILTQFLFGQSPKEIKSVSTFIKDMVHIPNTRFLLGICEDFKVNNKDSNIFHLPFYEQIKNMDSAFYMSNHEVSNEEYREFVNWVIDSLRQSNEKHDKTRYRYIDRFGKVKNIDILPDTSQWLARNMLHMGDPMYEYYFNKPDFANYPVVNISFEQAEAYTYWLSNKFSILLKKNHLYKENWGNFRIPSSEEWICAARYTGNDWLDENQTDRRIYAWKGSMPNDENGYFGNFGQIIDQNNICVKSYYHDGFIYTAPIKSYKPNSLGIYNLSGNVSEWTRSKAISIDSLKSYFSNQYKNLLGDKYAFLMEEITKENPNWKLFEAQIENNTAAYYNWNERKMADILYWIKDLKFFENHGMNVLSKHQNSMIVKGGSWYDALCYLLIDTEQVYPAQQSNPKIGFRIALKLDSSIEKKLGITQNKK